jgi:hypothetical protein
LDHAPQDLLSFHERPPTQAFPVQPKYVERVERLRRAAAHKEAAALALRIFDQNGEDAQGTGAEVAASGWGEVIELRLNAC